MIILWRKFEFKHFGTNETMDLDIGYSFSHGYNFRFLDSEFCAEFGYRLDFVGSAWTTDFRRQF